MPSVVTGALKLIKGKGIGGFFREIRNEGYLSGLLDGNLMQTKIHNIGATVVGVDKFGNKYHEKLGDTQYGGITKLFVCCGFKQRLQTISRPSQAPIPLPTENLSPNMREFQEGEIQEPTNETEIQEYPTNQSSVSAPQRKTKTPKEKWKNSLPRMIKVDTDASWSEELKAWFTGVIVRDTTGSIVVALVFVKKELIMDNTSFEGELYGVDQAINYMLNWDDYEFQKTMRK